MSYTNTKYNSLGSVAVFYCDAGARKQRMTYKPTYQGPTPSEFLKQRLDSGEAFYCENIKAKIARSFCSKLEDRLSNFDASKKQRPGEFVRVHPKCVTCLGYDIKIKKEEEGFDEEEIIALENALR